MNLTEEQTTIVETMFLSTIVDMRSQNNQPTIIISNLEPAEIMENIVVRTMTG